MTARLPMARDAAALSGAGFAGLDSADLVRLVVRRDVTCAAPPADLATMEPETLRATLGLSPGQAEALAAAFELGRRVGFSPPRRGDHCLSPETVYGLFRDVACQEVEEFWVALLDVRGRLLQRRRVARGSVSQCPVNPRDVLAPAVRSMAHSLVMVHNHPSGDPTPSGEDASLTARLKVACELVGVVPRDHVIVAARGYYSFVENERWRSL